VECGQRPGAKTEAASSSGRTRAAFFDCDGVLLESAQIKTDAFATLFASHPRHVAAIVDLHEAHGGISRYTKFEWIYRDILDEPLDAALSASLGAEYSAIVYDALLACPLVPGVVEALEALRPSHRCAVVSGSPHDELVDVLQRRGLLHLFDAAFGAPHEKAPSMRACLGDWRIPAARSVMVGDAMSDFDAAASLCVRFIGRVPPGASSPFPLGTLVLDDLTGLLSAMMAPHDDAEAT
jgi:phosphoglycolate phosphatase-like HAD superfamily hydrolase